MKTFIETSYYDILQPPSIEEYTRNHQLKTIAHEAVVLLQNTQNNQLQYQQTMQIENESKQLIQPLRRTHEDENITNLLPPKKKQIIIDDSLPNPPNSLIKKQSFNQPEEKKTNGFQTETERYIQDEMKKGNTPQFKPKKKLPQLHKPQNQSDETDRNNQNNQNDPMNQITKSVLNQNKKKKQNQSNQEDIIDNVNGVPLDDHRLVNIDPLLLTKIMNEILDKSPNVNWDDIAGLQSAKQMIYETVIWPMKRPDIFTGLRAPPKGLLLFGPPGTGKTMIGKAIASQCEATFFSISSSALTSKWIGEGEKLVRALFAVASCYERSVIFIDEIDSLLSARSETEHESSRRIKTEFLVRLDGAATEDSQFLVIGATNRPQELDDAARRRLVKRLYIPLPDLNARKTLVSTLLKKVPNEIDENELEEIGIMTDGYSGSDMKELVKDAAYGPIRELSLLKVDIDDVHSSQVRPVRMIDFKNSIKTIRPSVSQNDLQSYIDWNKLYGSF